MLTARVDELRNQARQRLNWKPGMLLERRQQKTLELLNSVKANLPQTQSPLFEGKGRPRRLLDLVLPTEQRKEQSQQQSVMPPVKVPIYACPCGFETTSYEEFEKHQQTKHRSTVRSYG
jgi:hypothetical protein